ncbi:ornithine cyclodeaminase family protein [Roseiarcus sp.]|uniref:ornithine cyclodeaminase family protein n=1 Tax=Roseiarcus sp. TaxID=1969460 RepID=UPI003F9C4DB6
MRVFSSDDLDRTLDFPTLIVELAEAMRGGFIAPHRHHHPIGRAGEPQATHLLMPAWTESASRAGLYLGVKVVNVFPGNAARALPTVTGLYVLQSGRTGETLAAIDGTRLTHWRTAAASALAARHLTRADSKRLLIVGAGALAPFMARAHASVRRYNEVAVWNHRPEGARRLAMSLADAGLNAKPTEDLEAAVSEADVISCATLATEPLIAGQWLRPGQHLDLVGAFNVSMREADDEALRRAHIFIDTDAALTEGGDVAAGILGGVIDRSAVIANLPALCRGAPGRRTPDEITLFKSVGAAIEDLAAAILVWRKSGGAEP